MLSFKMEPTRLNATTVRTLQRLANDAQAIDGLSLSAEINKDVNPQGDVTVRIPESGLQNNTATFHPGRVKIEMEIPPEQAERQYEIGSHTFYFEGATKVGDLRIRMISAEEFKEHAISMPTSIFSASSGPKLESIAPAVG
jgi:hypothetical protein